MRVRFTHIRADAPPMPVMHADSDTMAPWAQSTAFVTALTAAGAAVELVLVPGAGHLMDDAEHPSAVYQQAIRFLRGLAQV